MELIRMTSVGMIQKGDILILNTTTGLIAETAKIVLQPAIAASSNGEEVVYRKKKNHYFITNLVLTGRSWIKEVYIVRN